MSIRNNEEKVFYVYVVKCKDTIVYVGKGRDQRYQSHLKGKSSCKHLNLLYELYPEDLTSVIVKDNMCEKESLKFESELIHSYGYSNLFNLRLTSSIKNGSNLRSFSNILFKYNKHNSHIASVDKVNGLIEVSIKRLTRGDIIYKESHQTLEDAILHVDNFIAHRCAHLREILAKERAERLNLDFLKSRK